jgi:predicted nucleic acid-binding Zn ribbon protein
MAKPEALGAILARKLKSLGIQKKLKETSITELWPDIVGDAVAEHTEVIRCTDGKLFVRVDSATWRQELIFQRVQFIKKLNGTLGEAIVKDIHFTGP